MMAEQHVLFLTVGNNLQDFNRESGLPADTDLAPADHQSSTKSAVGWGRIPNNSSMAAWADAVKPALRSL
jgi:hypothetical protein